jgi:hypothetical protein
MALTSITDLDPLYPTTNRRETFEIRLLPSFHRSYLIYGLRPSKQDWDCYPVRPHYLFHDGSSKNSRALLYILLV